MNWWLFSAAMLFFLPFIAAIILMAISSVIQFWKDNPIAVLGVGVFMAYAVDGT